MGWGRAYFKSISQETIDTWREEMATRTTITSDPTVVSEVPVTTVEVENELQPPFLGSPHGIAILGLNGLIVLAIVLFVIGSLVRRKERRALLSMHEEILLQRRQQFPQHQQLPPAMPSPLPVQPLLPPVFPGIHPLARTRDSRTCRSHEEGIYDLINEDNEERIAGGARAHLSEPDVRLSSLPANYLHPIPPSQEAVALRGRISAFYQNVTSVIFKAK
ncbi:uncharacterized protein [Littorina saxatilis]|uniref:uncharacterized protein n=1 Tax=Littorina saxatilis TaxID=31220 RepID=UPI0038B64E85